MTKIVEGREALARELLTATEPDELEFFAEYARAVAHKGKDRRLGPEFGIPEVANIGPAIVAIGLFLFDVLKSWLAEVPKKTVESFLVDRGKEGLKDWLPSPEKGKLAAIVTVKGKAEILAIVGRLIVEAKLSPQDAERVTRTVASYLFGDDDGKR